MKSFTRRLLLVSAIAAAIPAVHAQTSFPTKAVKIVVPFAPGGSSDNSARILAKQLAEKWKQPVIIENKPGSNGSIGAQQVAKSAADGHTILYAPVSIGTVNLFVKNPGFDPVKDLQPVTQVARGDYVLVVQKDLPVNTIGEFADYARKNPGKVFNGSFGGASQLAFEQLSETLKFPATNVAYRGESLALTDLMGGQIQSIFATLVTANPYVESGKIKALGLASKARSPIAPNIKSADESGAKGFYVDFWFGLMVPAGTPKAIVDIINKDTKEALLTPEVKERLMTTGLNASPTTPAEFGKIVKYESERWVETAKRAGIQAQ